MSPYGICHPGGARAGLAACKVALHFARFCQTPCWKPGFTVTSHRRSARANQYPSLPGSEWGGAWDSGGLHCWPPKQLPPMPAAPTVRRRRGDRSERRDREKAGRWRHAPLHLSPECNVTQDIGRWQRKFKGKTQLFMARASAVSSEAGPSSPAHPAACMRADGAVCAVLSLVQLSIYYYSASPDPISRADARPGPDARSPGQVDEEVGCSSTGRVVTSMV